MADVQLPKGVKTWHRDARTFEGEFRGYTLSIDRERHGSLKGLWYIVVTAANGMRDYDGWWENSQNNTLDEAIIEALAGACLLDKRTKLYKQMLLAGRTCAL